ncbi:winged helix-turn-helix domain-containing protein [Kocuria sp.]|uniref:winged helix-turn-helix domain-containing protein n=1 Tax=Kocuria sp. TaxID=1871328 RepID=UPI0026DC93E2|nr:winged helix-turn-helix domain-containing protein [Kocuria sp.]MDO4919741.1 winged helix-turn-helix domain-containing protein [Kocuria sp.]
MFALTIDRRGSQRHARDLDMRAERENLRRTLPRPVLDWDISAGDELQALYDDPASACRALFALADSGEWHVGMGIGDVDRPLAQAVRESTGPAFVAARQAVEAAKERETPALCGTAWAQRAEAVLTLVCAVRSRRSGPGREAAALADAGLTQREMAEHLGITQSSVSRRLGAALWQQEQAARASVTALLALADAAVPYPAPSNTEEP